MLFKIQLINNRIDQSNRGQLCLCKNQFCQPFFTIFAHFLKKQINFDYE